MENTENKITENKIENELESDDWLFDSNKGISKRDISGFNYNILGTENNLHYITTCEELQDIANDLEADYELIQNIDCSNTRNWNDGLGFIPIGGSNYKTFKGTFNGNKYNISGLHIDRPTVNEVGLFGAVFSQGSKISNVGLIDIDVTGHDIVGGLVGLNYYGSIMNTFAIGKIHANGKNVGGLVGKNRGVISNSYTIGQVAGINYVGGLVGSNHKTIGNSYSVASVDGVDGKLVGGLVGSNWASIYDSFSSGRVENGGGLVGYSFSGEVFNSYWDIEASEQSESRGGSGKTPAEMKKRPTYQGWNFFEIWQIKDGDSYPTLRETPFQINFSNITSPQMVKTSFEITLTASDAGFSGRIFFDCARGKISPSYVDMVNSVWTGEVLLHSLGKDNHLALRWLNNEDNCSGTSISNTFDVVNENSQIPSNAVIIGKVVDNLQKPIADAKVELYSENPKYDDVLISTVTDSGGNYKFENLFPEEFFLKIHKPGYQTNFQTINTAANIEITGNAELKRSCTSTKRDLVPVLLVPGIMGSKSQGILFPSLPKITPLWNEGKLSLHDPFYQVGWEGIKLMLKEIGYVEGCTLFDVPYDWTLSVENIRDQFLIPWIKRAKKTNTKVDIVAHSMGGLVARSYIQSDKYAGDVRKLAMVGTPNKGSNMAYYVWEGGDTIKADGGQPYFYTSTLFYLYRDRFSESICSYDFLGFSPKECNVIETYKFAHKSVHSLGQLMPIYDHALRDHKTNKIILIEKEENTFLKALNNLDCLSIKGCLDFCGQHYNFVPPSLVLSPNKSESKVETKLFVGNNQKTLHTIFVKPRPSSYSGELYKDGKPELDPVYVTDGDKTVLSHSVIFNDYLPSEQMLTVDSESGEHSSLIGFNARKILEFLTDDEHPNLDVKVETSKEPVLIIAIYGRVQPTVRGPTDIKIIEKDLELNYAIIEINNLEDGDYTVTLQSSYNEDYEISLTYVHAVHQFFSQNRLRGYYNNTLTTFTFSLNLQSDINKIKFDRTFSTPVELQMRTNTDLQVQLTWEDPTGDSYNDVEYYSIFWKRNYEAYFQLLAHVHDEKSYQTNHSWIDAIENTYVVKAQLKNDSRSTFFSPPTWVNSESSASSATSLVNPFSTIISTVRSCINKVFTLFTPSAAVNLVIEEFDNTDLAQSYVLPSYHVSTKEDILSQSTESGGFISFADEGKRTFSDETPMTFKTPIENLHANIMLGHLALHWMKTIFQWIPKKLSNSGIEKVNKRKKNTERFDDFPSQLARLKETLSETEKEVGDLIKIVGKESIKWAVWGFEDYMSDIQKLEHRKQVNAEEMLELQKDTNYFISKVHKKYNQTVQTPHFHQHDDCLSIGSVYENRTHGSRNIFTEKFFISRGVHQGFLPVFSREIRPLNQNIDDITVECAKVIT